MFVVPIIVLEYDIFVFLEFIEAHFHFKGYQEYGQMFIVGNAFIE